MFEYLLDYSSKLWAFCFAIVYLTCCEQDILYIGENSEELFFRLDTVKFMIRLMIGLMIYIIVHIVRFCVGFSKKYLMKCKLLYNRLTTVKYICSKIKFLFYNSIYFMCSFKILL